MGRTRKSSIDGKPSIFGFLGTPPVASSQILPDKNVATVRQSSCRKVRHIHGSYTSGKTIHLGKLYTSE